MLFILKLFGFNEETIRYFSREKKVTFNKEKNSGFYFHLHNM